MPAAPLPPDESDRIAALHELQILDTPPEERFDRLSRLAAQVFQVPVAYVAFLERERQWYKSAVGLGDLQQNARETALCSHTILADEPLVCPDATQEPRFQDNPNVVGPPGVRFYMGHPLNGPGGHRVGTFCVLDVQPRAVTDAEKAMFRDLAAVCQSELDLVDAVALQRELRRGKEQLREAYRELAEAQAQLVQSGKMAALGQLAAGVAHELNTPLASLMLSLEGALRKPETARPRLERALRNVGGMREIVSKLLHYSHVSVGRVEDVHLDQVVRDTLQLVGHSLPVEVELDLEPGPPLAANPNEVQQVLINLLFNAGHSGTPRIRVEQRGRTIKVRDWGCGIPLELQDRIFEPFFTTREVGQGTGLGLSLSQQVVRRHGGELTVRSEPGQGAEFTVTL